MQQKLFGSYSVIWYILIVQTFGDSSKCLTSNTKIVCWRLLPTIICRFSSSQLEIPVSSQLAFEASQVKMIQKIAESINEISQLSLAWCLPPWMCGLWIDHISGHFIYVDLDATFCTSIPSFHVLRTHSRMTTARYRSERFCSKKKIKLFLRLRVPIPVRWKIERLTTAFITINQSYNNSQETLFCAVNHLFGQTTETENRKTTETTCRRTPSSNQFRSRASSSGDIFKWREKVAMNVGDCGCGCAGIIV